MYEASAHVFLRMPGSPDTLLHKTEANAKERSVDLNLLVTARLPDRRCKSNARFVALKSSYACGAKTDIAVWRRVMLFGRRLVKLQMTLAALLAAPACAQAPPANPPPRCETAIYKAFDFWVGEWEVFNPAGQKLGTSSITREESGCLIVEHWTSARGNNGQSYNFYDPSRQQWRQVWASPTELTDYAGNLNAKGEMVLEGDLQQAGGYGGRSRGTWTKNADGSVRQRFENYDAAKSAWVENFNGLYKKQG